MPNLTVKSTIRALMEMSVSQRASFIRDAIRVTTMELEMELAERELEAEVVENIRNSA
jgi:hypothetical protein